MSVACGHDGDVSADSEPPRVVLSGGETETPQPQDPTEAPTEVASPPQLGDAEPPTTTASANGASVEMGIGTYCWTMLCVDKIGVVTRGSLSVSRGDLMEIEVPQAAPALREVSVGAFPAEDFELLENGDRIWPYSGWAAYLGNTVRNDTIDVEVDLDPGVYVLTVGMYFEGGDVVYGVVLDVE